MTDTVGRDIFWTDTNRSGDREVIRGTNNQDVIYRVENFSNPSADRTLNFDRIPDPARPDPAIDRNAPAGTYWERSIDVPLFAEDGPQPTDIKQGAIGDCKILSAMGSLIHNTRSGNNWLVYKSMTDFGDGTFGVKLGSRFYRVDDDVVHTANGGYLQTSPGREDSIWPAIMEKAVAYKYSANLARPRFWTAASVGSVAIFTDFGATNGNSPFINEFASSRTQFADRLWAKWNNYDNVTITLPAGMNSVGGGHAYTLWQVNKNSAGTVTSIVLRNPWGRDGSANGYNDGNDADAIVTYTPAQLWAVGGSSRVNFADPISLN